jgi:Zn-finger nucleic acid-binding protein
MLPNYLHPPSVDRDMKCPVDSIDLIMSERSGVEIDYCPQCRGVWLDRGELDKIIDRANEAMGGGAQAPARPAAPAPPPLYPNFEPRCPVSI